MDIEIKDAGIGDIETIQQLNYELFLEELQYDRSLIKEWSFSERSKKMVSIEIKTKNWLCVYCL